MACTDREQRRRDRVKAGRLKGWKLTGSLYSTRAEDYLTTRIREDVAAEFGPIVESTDPPGDIVEPGEGSDARIADSHVPAMTLAEIAEELGITRERVRQIETSALAKMKRALERFALGHDPGGRS